MTDKILEIVPHLRDEDLHTWHHVGTGNVLVVCFSPTGDQDPHIPQEPSFPQVATNGGKRHVIFISDPKRTWLNGPNLREKIFFEVQKFKEQVKAKTIVTLGHSMGGFYALACAADLGAKSAVALAPQLTIHPDIAADDRRWQNFRQRISTFRFEGAYSLMTADPEYFVFHGEMPREAPQRDRTPRGKNITHIILPDVHHNVPAILKRHDLQQDVINACFSVNKTKVTSLLKPLKAYKRTLKKQPERVPVTHAKAASLPGSITPPFDRNSISYFFVMDGATFERPALLLAQSIRGTLGDGPQIIAYTPETKIDEIHPVTRRMLNILGVDVRTFDSTNADWTPHYPQGNKLLAAMEKRETDLSVFLDTDVVLLNAPDFSLVTPETPVFATPEGVRTWAKDQEDWTPVYGMFGLQPPNWRVRLTKGRGMIVLPYYNAGVVGFVEKGNAAGQRLPDLWLDTALTIDANADVPNKRPWLDQISLPIAAERMGGRSEVLPNQYNFSPYRLKGEENIDEVVFLHYRMPQYFRQYAPCKQITEDLLMRAPERMRSRILRRMGPFVRGIDLPEDLLQ